MFEKISSKEKKIMKKILINIDVEKMQKKNLEKT